LTAAAAADIWTGASFNKPDESELRDASRYFFSRGFIECHSSTCSLPFAGKIAATSLVKKQQPMNLSKEMKKIVLGLVKHF